MSAPTRVAPARTAKQRCAALADRALDLASDAQEHTNEPVLAVAMTLIADLATELARMSARLDGAI